MALPSHIIGQLPIFTGALFYTGNARFTLAVLQGTRVEMLPETCCPDMTPTRVRFQKAPPVCWNIFQLVYVAFPIVQPHKRHCGVVQGSNEPVDFYLGPVGECLMAVGGRNDTGTLFSVEVHHPLLPEDT